MALTARERIEAVFRFEQPDHVPAYGWMCNDAIIQHFGGEPLTVESAPEVVPRALRRCMDLVAKNTAGRPILPEREREETDELGYARRYTRWTDWVTGLPYPPGDTETMAQVIRHEIELFRSWDEGEVERHLARVDDLQARLGDDALVIGRYSVVTGPGCYTRDGLDNFSYFLADYPGLSAEWVQARHERSLRMIDRLSDASRYPVDLAAGDLAYNNAMLFSPQWLRESGWFRRLTEIVDAFHQQGVKVIYHSDGDLREVLPDLVASGIDGLTPIDVAAGMDLAELRREYDRLVLSCGLPYHVLAGGTPDEVRRVTEAALRAASPGYIAGSSSEEFSQDMPLENYLAMFETVRSWRP